MYRQYPVANVTPFYLVSLVPPRHEIDVIDEALCLPGPEDSQTHA
jgi:hypothetical protein